MQTDNNTLIDELLGIVEKTTEAAREFKSLGERELNYREAPDRWSILECIEHLNRYGDFYLPELQRALLKSSTTTGSGTLKSGVIGNYFAKLMQVRNGKMVKMKTPSVQNPLGSNLTVLTIDRFLKQQETLKILLAQARTADLTNTKVRITLTKFVKLRLGDMLRVLVYHIERHIFQAQNVNRRLLELSGNS
jgi:hypothetical protein